MAESFERLLDDFPDAISTVADLTRHLGTGRSVCQRITLAVRGSGDPLDVLQRFPGVRGLRQVLDAAERAGADAGCVAAARAAANDYAALIGAAGGSHRRLVAAVHDRKRSRATSSLAEKAPAVDEVELRRRLFEAAAAFTGARCRARVEVNLIRPCSDDETKLEMAQASGLYGVSVDTHGVPIARVTRAVGQAGRTYEEFDDLSTHEKVLGVAPGAILSRFSSTPLPTTTARGHDGSLVLVFNPEGKTERPLDIMVGTASSPAADSPLHSEPNVINVMNVIGTPSLGLLTVVMLDRTLAQQSLPFTAVSRMAIGGLRHAHPQDRWYEHLPGRPTIEMLPPNREGWSSSLYPRLSEMASHLFACTGWDPASFVGYKVEVRYPVWEGEYILCFDFGGLRNNQIPEAFRR